MCVSPPPVSFGLMLMAQLPAVMARYPGLTVELVMEDRFGDMIEERLDLAIRVGEVSTQTLIKRSLGTVTRVAVAAPAYLQRRGSPLNPDELIDHDCIVHRVEPGETEWRLTGPNCSVGVSVRGVVSTNNHEAVRGAALSGLGIGLLPPNTWSSMIYWRADWCTCCRSMARRLCQSILCTRLDAT